MEKSQSGQTMRLWGILGGLCALSLCFVLTVRPDAPVRETAVSAEKRQTVAEDALQSFRQERERIRKMEIEQLEKLAGDADSAVAAQAKQQLLELTGHMDEEMVLEGLLAAEGFRDAAVSVRTGSVNVMVRGNGISRRHAALITDAAVRETGQTVGSIRIIPVPDDANNREDNSP